MQTSSGPSGSDPRLTSTAGVLGIVDGLALTDGSLLKEGATEREGFKVGDVVLKEGAIDKEGVEVGDADEAGGLSVG